MIKFHIDKRFSTIIVRNQKYAPSHILVCYSHFDHDLYIILPKNKKKVSGYIFLIRIREWKDDGRSIYDKMISLNCVRRTLDDSVFAKGGKKTGR